MNRSPNRYFNNYNFGPTQKLIEDLIVEAIRIHGTWIFYMPRTKTNIDAVFGEDSVSRFEDAVQIEAYIKNFDSFEGQGKLLSKFGVEIRDEMTFVIARRRFEESRAEHLLTETGQNLEQELTNRYHAYQINGILLEEGNRVGTYIEYSRPREGDLIYLPVVKKLFEIKYTQTDAIFFQGGQLQTFEMNCELFEYSQEEFNTGYTPVDSIEDLFSSNVVDDSIASEDGFPIAMEQGGGTLTQERSYPEAVDKLANNSLYSSLSTDIIDFSEISPFILRDETLKW